MRKVSTFILILLLCSFWVVFSNIGIMKAKSNSLVTVTDEHFIIREVLGAFNNFFVGSFNASGGYWIELDLSCQSTDNGPFIVYLHILSATHGSIFSAKGTEFSQTVYLDYEDVYNITIAKSPFYSSVRINGIIDVFHQEPVEQSSENWVEVTRFTGNEDTQTESFTCDYVEWRIRWNYSTVFHLHQKTLGLFGLNVFEKEPKSLVSSFGSEPTIGSENGTLSLSENGTFYLQIYAFNIYDYSVIIEQNIESIPEFPSWTILPLILTITLFSVVVKRKLCGRNREYCFFY